MPDPFQKGHEAQRRKDEADRAKAGQQAHTAGIQQRLAAQKKQAERPANWDVGIPWRKKFWEPGY